MVYTVQIPVIPGIQVPIGRGTACVKEPWMVGLEPFTGQGRMLASISVAALGVGDLTHSLCMSP